MQTGPLWSFPVSLAPVLGGFRVCAEACLPGSRVDTANTFPASGLPVLCHLAVHAYLKVSECPHSTCGVSFPQQHSEYRPHTHTKTRFSLQYLKYCHCAWLYKSCTRKQISKTSSFLTHPTASRACNMLYLLLCGQLEPRATREASAGVP